MTRSTMARQLLESLKPGRRAFTVYVFDWGFGVQHTIVIVRTTSGYFQRLFRPSFVLFKPEPKRQQKTQITAEPKPQKNLGSRPSTP